MRVLLASAVLAASIAIGGSTAFGDPPPPTCQGNPHFCDTQIEVTNEPPGENCEFGGIKITITRTPPVVVRTDEEPPLNPPPPPEPEVEVFYVCNGADGEPGPPGPPGPDGTTVPIGGIGDISQITDVNVNIGGRGHCRSIRENVRLTLPVRMRAEDTVRVKVDRERAISQDVVRSRFVRVNMRGKRCGAHLVQVRKAGIDPSLRLWTVPRDP